MLSVVSAEIDARVALDGDERELRRDGVDASEDDRIRAIYAARRSGLLAVRVLIRADEQHVEGLTRKDGSERETRLERHAEVHAHRDENGKGEECRKRAKKHALCDLERAAWIELASLGEIGPASLLAVAVLRVSVGVARPIRAACVTASAQDASAVALLTHLAVAVHVLRL